MVRATVRRRSGKKKAKKEGTGLNASWAISEVSEPPDFATGSPRRAALKQGAIVVAQYIAAAGLIVCVWWIYGRSIVAWLLGVQLDADGNPADTAPQ